MSCQNDGRIYKSKNIDWIGVGRHQNVRDFKKKSIEKMREFITESGLLENIYYNELSNNGRIYKSINIEWIGVGRHENVRDLKKKWIEKMWEFITESWLLENIYYNELSKWWKNL